MPSVHCKPPVNISPPVISGVTCDIDTSTPNPCQENNRAISAASTWQGKILQIMGSNQTGGNRNRIKMAKIVAIRGLERKEFNRQWPYQWLSSFLTSPNMTHTPVTPCWPGPNLSRLDPWALVHLLTGLQAMCKTAKQPLFGNLAVWDEGRTQTWTSVQTSVILWWFRLYHPRHKHKEMHECHDWWAKDYIDITTSSFPLIRTPVA